MNRLSLRFTRSSFGLAALAVTSAGLLTFGGACSPSAPQGGTGGALGSGGAVGSGGALQGSGGAVATGGAVGSGGTTGSGGAGPASGGAVGSGGATGSGGETASGGAGSGGQTGTDCSSLPVCDDFEGVAAGMPPDPATWTTELDWSGTGDASKVTVSTDDAHSTSQSVKISGNNTAPWIFEYANPGETFYARAYFKTGDPGTSGTILIGIGPANDHGDEIRLRLFNGKITINSASGGDGLAPDPSNCTDCIAVPIDTWFCAEMFYDGTTDTARIWIEGDLASEVVNNVGWHTGGNFPATAERVWFGTLAPNGSAPTVFVDDVAIGPNPIGCL